MFLSRTDKIAGSVFGLAYGDAYGARTEFMQHSNIIESGEGLSFPRDAYITDDTQMSLAGVTALNDALIETVASGGITAMSQTDEAEVALPFAAAYVDWLNDPQNLPFRAPGNTCLKALQTFEVSAWETGLEGIIYQSKGCGANMRAPWLGLMYAGSSSDGLLPIANLAAAQAAVTHGHPTGVAAAVGTALVTASIMAGTRPARFGWFNIAEQLCNDFVSEVTSRFPGSLSGLSEPVRLAVQGMPDILRSIEKSRNNFYNFIVSDEDTDLCSFFGEGWVAEEAFMCALGAVSRYAGDPVLGLQRLARTNGDSDSIGAIGGAYLGAVNGYQGWPAVWRDMLEAAYVPQLDSAVGKLNKYLI